MHSSRETRRVNSICFLLVILSSLSEPIFPRWKEFSVTSIRGMMMMAALFIWCTQMRRRVIQEEKRHYLTWMSLFIFSVLLAKMVNHAFLAEWEVGGRYIWYFYYTPIIFSALCIFFTVLCIGKPWDYKIEKKWKWLYVPAAILAVGMMTNDLHQQAFAFAEGAENWHAGDNYTHCFFYYLTMIWVLALAVLSLVIAMKRSSVASSRRRIWMPLLSLGIGVAYMIGVYCLPVLRYYFIFNMAEVFSILCITFIEGMIQAGLIHSNDDYEALWNLSAVSGGILDQKGRIRYHSGHTVGVSMAQAEAALAEPVPLQNGDLLLYSQCLRSGIGYWTEDVSKINSLNRQLKEYRNILTEENAMLEGENKLAQRKARIVEKTRLYDKMASSVGTQLEMMRDLLDQTEEIMKDAEASEDAQARAKAEQAIDWNMQRASLLAAYIKRHSNLLLLSQQGKVQAEELYLATAEVLEYVRMCGIRAYAECIGNGAFEGKLILLAGEFLETVIECSLPVLKVWMSFIETGQKAETGEPMLQIRLTVDTTGDFQLPSVWQERIRAFDGELHRQKEEETSYITLRLYERQQSNAN